MDWTNIYALADKIGDAVHKEFGIALLVMLTGGIVSAISPSSVPRMVAIVNYAGHEARTIWGAAKLSIAFVLGICVVYCGVGILAGSFSRLLMMTGFLAAALRTACHITSLAKALPPGESMRITIALTLSSREAIRSARRMSSEPIPSLPNSPPLTSPS